MLNLNVYQIYEPRTSGCKTEFTNSSAISANVAKFLSCFQPTRVEPKQNLREVVENIKQRIGELI